MDKREEEGNALNNLRLCSISAAAADCGGANGPLAQNKMISVPE